MIYKNGATPSIVRSWLQKPPCHWPTFVANQVSYIVDQVGTDNCNQVESKKLSISDIGWKNTYIIGHYNPSFRIIDLFSHTTYIMCVNFIHKWRNLQTKVDSER